MRKIVATAAFASLASTAAMLAPGSASAASLASGQYDLNGQQQICIQNTNPKTWYGTTFPNWGGRWGKKQKTVFIYGNYAAGAGNDSISIRELNGSPYKVVWIEWRDNFTFEIIIPKATLAFVKVNCDPPADASKAKAGANPGD